MRKSQGFTLIELVLTISMMAVISVVVGRVLFQGYQTVLTSENISETGWQGLIALQQITNDVHRIRSPGDIGTIATSQLSFTDVDGASVTYSLSGSNLLRNGVVLASGVQNLTFAYRTKSGAATTTASNVRYVQMSISLVKNNLSLSMSTMVGTRGMT